MFGVSITLRASNDALLRRMLAVAPPLAQRTTSCRVDRTFGLRAAGACRCGSRHERPALFGGARMYAPDSLNALVTRCGADVKLFVAQRAPRRVFVHAGVVAFDDRAVLLPGNTFSGKTTLVRALLDAGATYYSDEYAVLDARGRVHAYPQPLGIRTRDNTRQIATRAPRWGTKPLPIALVLLTEHRAGRHWTKPLSRARAILELTRHTVSYERDPVRALDYLESALRNARAFHGRRNDAATAARWIMNAL